MRSVDDRDLPRPRPQHHAASSRAATAARCGARIDRYKDWCELAVLESRGLLEPSESRSIAEEAIAIGGRSPPARWARAPVSSSKSITTIPRVTELVGLDRDEEPAHVRCDRPIDRTAIAIGSGRSNPFRFDSSRA